MKNKMDIYVITNQSAHKALSMASAIEVMQASFVSLSAKKIILPPRAIIKSQTQPGMLTAFMPAYDTNTEQLGIKVASLVPDNKARKLPFIQGVVILLDRITGQPKALIDGAAVTALKTGAASGLATKILARENAEMVAIIGAGEQARSQLRAICSVRPIKQVKVYSMTHEHAIKLATEMAGKEAIVNSIQVCTTVQEATQHADIICTATNSNLPIIGLSDVKPGVHINAVGGHTTTTREVSSELIAKALVVVEQKEATLRESCERNVLELGTLPKRQSEEQITIFASVGVAAQDLAIAEAIYTVAKKHNLGFFI